MAALTVYSKALRCWLPGVLLAGMNVLWQVPVTAKAHATLDRSVPADHARLSAPPDHVDLYFAQQLVQNRTGTFAIVFNRQGSAVSEEAQIDRASGSHLIVPLRGLLDAGVYSVFWKTTSDDDGGVSLGNITFSVGQIDPQILDQAPAGGQVLVPDNSRERALTFTKTQGGTAAPIAALGGGAAGGAIAGVGVYLVMRHRFRADAIQARAGRPGVRRR